MRKSYASGLVLLTAMLVFAGCDSATDATEVGELRTAIVSGASQITVAGAPRLPNAVIGQAQRVPLGSAIIAGGGLANATTTTVRGLPNVVMCVGEDQLDLIPFSRCVNTDTAGKAAFTFSPTTKAGTYRAKINFTLGAQESTIDSVVVTVNPDAADPSYRITGFPLLNSPAVGALNFVVDKFGNAIPYRIVGDGILTVLGDTVGTVAARSVSWSPSAVEANPTYRIVNMVGQQGDTIGRLRYRIGGVGGGEISWYVFGVALTQ